MTGITKELVIETLAHGIAGRILNIPWADTESQARMVATGCATILFSLSAKALAVKEAPGVVEYEQAVEDLLEFIGVPK